MDVCMQTKLININAMSAECGLKIVGFSFFSFNSKVRLVPHWIWTECCLLDLFFFYFCDGITFPQWKFYVNCDKKRERLAKADFWSKCFSNDVWFNIPFQLLFCSVESPHASNLGRAIHRSRMAQLHEHFQNTRWLSWFKFCVFFFLVELVRFLQIFTLIEISVSFYYIVAVESQVTIR